MVLEEFRLDNRVALVTGASRGLGRGIALTLAEAGADVVCLARTTEGIENTAAEVRSLGRRAHVITADVTCPEQVEASVEESLSVMGKIDILVNNAGAIMQKPVVPYPPDVAQEYPGSFISKGISIDEWHQIVDTSLTAAFLFCRTTGSHMMAQRHGKVINLVSVGGRRGFPFLTAYTAAKAGLGLFTRSLAREWGRFNIQVNAIGPVEVPTDMNAFSRRSEEATKRTLRNLPVGRFGTAREVGLLAVYLASSASDYMTGQCLYLDGGHTA